MREERLGRVREICLGFPEAEEEGEVHRGFRVRGKTFAWFLDDHHGDGRLALNVKAQPGVQEALVARDPGRFFVPHYVGHRGWVGIRLEDRPDWDEIADLLEESYRLTAPKRLGAAVAGHKSVTEG
jgi:hypothetical protein